MAQNKSYKELMELQGQSGGQQGAGTQSSNQMLDLILNRQPFQYNAQTDPAAQAARKTAARNAQAVTRDTLGQHAAMTGGMPSTAAVSAAAQAGSAAMQQGNDRVAQLEQLAFQNYQTEGQNMYNAFAAMQGTEEVAQARADAEYQKKLALAQLAASYGDYSGLKELGIDTSNYGAGGYSGGGGPRYYESGDDNPVQDDKPGDDKPGGISAADRNILTMAAYDNGGTVPLATWNKYAQIYGEDELIRAGFKKDAPKRESIGQPGRPTITPT